MNKTVLTSAGNILFVGQLEGGNLGGVAIKPLLPNVKVEKQFVIVVTGTSLKAQLEEPPPVFHTGNWPVITRLLVKTKAYMEAFWLRFPVSITWLPESGKAVT